MKKVRKAVIPVAGMGTRFLPITKSIPKEMLPIYDKPTIDYIIDEAIDSGIEEILLITSSYKKTIEDYFDRSFELEKRLEKSGKITLAEKVKKIGTKVKVFYIRQGEPMGSAHAISLAKNFINNEPFAVLYGDDLMMYETPVLRQLIDMYEKYDSNIIGVKEVDKDIVDRYGIVEYEDIETRKIKTIIEKPSIENAPSTSAGLGRYIVKPEIFDEIEKLEVGINGEYQFTDAMLNLMKYEDFYACMFDGKYFDTGNKLEYMKANIEFALKNKEVSDELNEYLKSFKC